jgi:transposase-like protein
MQNNKGRRYSLAEKSVVIAHVERINVERGRGGITHASKEFGVSPLTITNWLKPKNRSKSLDSHSLRQMAEDSEKLRQLADLLDQASTLRKELNLGALRV